MLGHRDLNLDDYLAILRRRVWFIVVPAVVVPIIAYAISLRIPPTYKSQTLVMVEGQKVPDSFVKPVVTELLNQRLATMQEQILSRTRLQPIIERFGLYKDSGAPLEEMVDQMRKAIRVTPIHTEITERGGGLPGFYVSFTADDPKLAQQVCAEITSMFMAENLHVREQSALGTTEFLRNQLDQAKRKLDEQDSKLAEFKQKYLGQLPGEEQRSMSMVLALRGQLDAVTQILNRAQQDKTFTEAALTRELTAWKAAQSNNSPQSLEQQLATVQTQLIALEGKYTADYPDVIKAKKEIELLKQKIEAAAAAAKNNPVPDNPKLSTSEPAQIQTLRTQLYQLNQTLQEKTVEQEHLRKDLRNEEAQLHLSPVVEEQFKVLGRDYQTALELYKDLLVKKTQSEMATDLEHRQQGEQFRVMDPPNLPEKPSSPKREYFALGGLGIGLGLGLLMAFLVEVRDKSIRTERDIEFFLELPTLASVPCLDQGSNGTRNFRIWNRKQAIPGITEEAEKKEEVVNV